MTCNLSKTHASKNMLTTKSFRLGHWTRVPLPNVQIQFHVVDPSKTCDLDLDVFEQKIDKSFFLQPSLSKIVQIFVQFQKAAIGLKSGTMNLDKSQQQCVNTRSFVQLLPTVNAVQLQTNIKSTSFTPTVNAIWIQTLHIV